MRDGTIRTDPGTAAAPGGTAFHHFAELDRDQAESMLARFYTPVRLDARPELPFHMTSSVLRLGPLTVGRLSFGPDTQLDTGAVAGYHVCMPVSGELHTWHNDMHTVSRPARGAAVFRSGRPAVTRHAAGTRELDVKIEESALEAELEALLDRSVRGPIDLAPTMDVSTGPGRTWAELVRLLQDESQDAGGLIYQPLIAERLWRSVLSGLLLAVPHRYAADLARPVRPGPPRAIRRVVDAIQAEPHRAYTVRDLAEAGGMSVRTLQEGFRRYLGATPMGYLQQVRLTKAHEALRRSDPHGTTVAAVAHRWGFTHLGRFAHAYRKHYGVHPSVTLRTD